MVEADMLLCWIKISTDDSRSDVQWISWFLRQGWSNQGVELTHTTFCNYVVKMRGAIHFKGMVLDLYQSGLVFKL